ncbi:hypothetical protein [uncultured Thiocystis sp.]|jgi:hypothetical protein|uniref:hypothetical protein n=1 Tax=uncultured Thiocystis sp. TaxID=1202134 RepID=UPI0025FB9634|nr:hypothetical protein [uncultured Thiocystis sp.]
METIFDHDPTPEELRYLAEPDAEAYRADITEDEALEQLCLLFAMRGDAERSAAYKRRISDRAYVFFNFDWDALIPPDPDQPIFPHFPKRRKATKPTKRPKTSKRSRR